MSDYVQEGNPVVIRLPEMKANFVSKPVPNAKAPTRTEIEINSGFTNLKATVDLSVRVEGNEDINLLAVRQMIFDLQTVQRKMEKML